MDKIRTVVLYHGECPDGFGAAYAFWKKFGNDAVYFPVMHGKEPPEITSHDDVYIIDFSYKRDVVLALKLKAKSLTIIDHHFSAEKDLEGLDFCHFNMKRSGACLAWEYLFDSPPPKMLQLIEERDLGRTYEKESPDIDAVLSAIDSYPMIFKEWDAIVSLLETEVGFENIKREGQAILRYKKFLENRIIQHAFKINLDGMTVPIVNTPFLQSELGARFAHESGIGLAYYFDGEQNVISFRSNGEFDVSKIAGKFGGGGHKAAAGCRVRSLKELSGEDK